MRMSKAKSQTEGIGTSKRNVLICLCLTVLVIGLYQPVRNYDFIGFDDRPYVSQNKHVLAGLTRDGCKWAFTSFHEANWHPLTWLSLMVDGELYGGHAGGYHWTNVMFHLANTLLLFLVLRGMTGARWRSGFVAALFAVHPLHVESVAWVAERKDVLSGFFWFLTLGAYVRYVASPSPVRYFLVVVSFVLGLLSKPMVVTLPLVLLLLDYWPLRRFASGGGTSGLGGDRFDGLKRVWSSFLPSRFTEGRLFMETRWPWLVLEKLPLLFLSALSSAVTIYAQSQYRVVASLDALPLGIRVENALLSYFLYIKKMFWPVDLAVFYPHSVASPLTSLQVVLLVIFMLMVSILALRFAKARPYLPVGWFWYLGVLVPAIGLVQVGAQAMADRYAYLPLIGLYVVMVWGCGDLLRDSRRRNFLALLLVAVTITPLALVTQRQLRYWLNGVTMFSHTIAVTKNNYVAENNLGLSLLEQGRFLEAVGHFEAALRIRPDFAVAYHNLGVALQALGRHEEAARAYRQEIQINGGTGEAYYRLGISLSREGKLSEAVAVFRKAIEHWPDAPGGYAELGTVLTALGRFEEAKKAYEQALRLQDDHAGIHNNYAMLLMRMGEREEAVKHFREALRLQPRYANAHYQLSVILREKGDAAAAASHLRSAIEINPEFKDLANR